MLVSTGDIAIKYTPEQEASIKYRGGALLVSAAAGSGKTKVLVERLLSFVDEGVNIDEFLVITYTRAAAYELRERIYDELLNRLSKSPGNTRLRRQVMLCKGASIDTIHTFCSEVLRENAHLVKLPPDFRVADESESAMIMTEVADKVFSEIYEKLNEYPGFTDLIDIIADKRDDRLLVEVLLTLYKKLQSSPNPNNWVKKQIDKQMNIANINDISEIDFGAYMLNRLKRIIGYCQAELLNLRTLMTQHSEFENKYAESVDSVIEQIYPLLRAIELGWDEARRHSRFEFIRPKPIKGYEVFKETRLRCIKELNICLQELEYSSKEHIKDAKDISTAIVAILQLLLDFSAAYSEEKRKRGVADFSDLEHLTLSLLVDKETGTKTPLARNMSLRFKEIMIDEYQDVNAVQEYIFTVLSNNSENIFMVGDVKQSIYRFRLADPTIFLSKYNNFSEYDVNAPPDPMAKGKKIHLSRNFRSHDGILGVVNHIFCNIMSKDFGELEYTEKERLIPGRSTEERRQGKQGKQGNRVNDHENVDMLTRELPEEQNKCSPVEINILDMSTFDSEDDEESPTAIKIEAEFIAQRIKKLFYDGYKIQDATGGERTIRYSDIVILLRSIKGRAWQYAAALAEHDIPVDFPGGEGYFDTVEVTAAVSLLSVIDNPIQDIPLAAVMSGPLYRFSSNELAELKGKIHDKDLHSTIKESAEHDNMSQETRLKCRKILVDIEELRLISLDMPSDRFIWSMYNRTGLLEKVSRMRGGEKRKNNLILLAESARLFEKSGYKGIFGFLRFIRNLQIRGVELPGGFDYKSSTMESIDSIKIMSIHKSKGLEFPVVILANTSKLNNFQDIRENVVFHNDLGLAAKLTDKKRRIKYTTLARTAIQHKLNDEMLSEELRVLYVAMTRAREKLIITAALRNTGRTLEKLSALPTGIVAPQAVKSLRSTIEWILAGISGIDEIELTTNYLDAAAFKSMLDSMSVVEKQIVSITADDQQFATINAVEQKLGSPSESNLSLEHDLAAAFISDSSTSSYFDFSYTYKRAVDLPSKLTVTGLKALLDPEAEIAPWVRKVKKENIIYQSPSFISGKKEMTAVDRGILLHLVMQHIDYNMCSHEPREHAVLKCLQQLNTNGILTSEQIDEVDIKKIVKFLSSALGGRMTNAIKLVREFKFSILRPAEDFFSGGGTDKILLQGVVDCYFEEDDKIVVVDFKTDNVTEKTVDKVAHQYFPQLNAYADALHHITGKHVKERIIYFFSINRAYNLN